MKLYHLSNCYLTDHLFYPRIPQKIGKFEDRITDRICASTSISGCILSIKDSIIEKFYDNKKSIVYAIHMFDVKNKDIIVPNKKMVFDSIVTNEYWIIRPFKSKVIGIINIFKNLDSEIIYYYNN